MLSRALVAIAPAALSAAVAVDNRAPIHGEDHEAIRLKLFLWDDDWEPSDHLKAPIAAPKGSRLEVVAHFDNSAANENNPDPKQRVRYGEEAMDAFVDYPDSRFLIPAISSRP